MSDDWTDDPFADPDDPAAREREQRRLEREERRRQRQAKQSEKTKQSEKKATPPPAQPPATPPPPRTPEEEFWDEDPAPEEPIAKDGRTEDPALESSAPQGPAAKEPPGERPGTEEPGAGRSGRWWQRSRPAAESSAADEVGAQPALEPAWAVPDDGDPTLARGANGRGPRRPGGGGVLGSLRRHPFRIFAAIAAIFVVWFLFALFQPFHGDGSGRVQVRIPKGSSVSEVGDLLGEKGVIDSSTLFQIRVTLEGKRSEIYSGHFTLAHGMSYGAAIDALSKPPVKRTTTVTIPEGYSRPQAAELVEEDGVPGSYTKATVHSKYLNPAAYGGKGAKSLEGFLFPDTFELKPNEPVADLVQLQLEDFKRRIKGVDMSYARSKNLTIYDVLTIASMVEREAGVPSQRKLVASVIYNRLHEGMPLGIDATIRFATGNYSEPLTESQLATGSPYNTRTNTGLPPGPINSPGLAAIEAAAHPAKTGYLFYVNDPSTCNKLAFAKTEAEFERDVKKYESAREAAGGNAPSTCGE